MQLTIGILTGGKSTRMGMNKAWINFQHKTLLEHKIDLFQGDDEILISVDDPSKYKGIEKMLVIDRYQDIGPIAGIYECLLQAKNDWVFITSVDTPRIDRKIGYALSEYVSDDVDCVIAKTDRLEPLTGLYHKRLLPMIQKTIEEGAFKLQDFIRSQKFREVNFFNRSYDFLNINTPDDILKTTPILSICGFKNTGKTTLIEKLIPKFKADGLRIAVIKHDGHDFDIAGTDSDKYFQAHADEVMLFSSTKYMILRKEQTSIEQLLHKVEHKDFILIEGLKDHPFPKIEITDNGILSCNRENLLAVVGQHPDYPSFHRDDIDALYAWIKEEYHL